MNYELFIARRLRLSDESRRGMSPGIIIAIAGIALSMMIMMVAMSIVYGFKKEIRNKVTGFDSQVTIHPASYESGIDADYLDMSNELLRVISGTGFFDTPSLVIQQPAIIKTDSTFQAIVVKGISPGPGWNFVRDNVADGDIPDYADPENRNKVVVSRIIAGKLGLAVGDKVNAYFFVDNALKARRMDVAAIYDTNFGDYDKAFVFSSLPFAQSLAAVGENTGSRIELMTNGSASVDESALKLQNEMMLACYTGKLKGTYRLSTVSDNGMMYFNWLELLDTNVVVILVLMALVSGFTLISSLFIIILERVNMIGILKALGSTDGEIRRIFSYVAQKLVIAGILIGDLIGISFLLIQKYTRLLPLDPDAYYLDYVPVEVNWWQILLLNICVFVLCWLMILVPGQIVARINPATSIRYE
ncbi:MAG: ABC transporter permease [Bacteroides sp.]|nr:ABC transporter permease [Bacteroides sp.]MCM1388998.1 ABC transporter permease [Bacteroides sp.]